MRIEHNGEMASCATSNELCNRGVVVHRVRHLQKVLRTLYDKGALGSESQILTQLVSSAAGSKKNIWNPHQLGLKIVF